MSELPAWWPSDKPYIIGDCLSQLKTLPDEVIQCCVTSPPYWGLRDYGVEGQYGLEETPEMYVAKMVEVFHEVKRVLRPDGTLWLNLGDSYTGPKGNTRGEGAGGGQERGDAMFNGIGKNQKVPDGLKPKDLVGIPWRVAFALQADGWYLRQDIIWSKPNPMPESVTDRCTKSHEYVFLMAKSQKYYYDNEAIKEPCVEGSQADNNGSMNKGRIGKEWWTYSPEKSKPEGGRNKRSVWTITTKPYSEAHFATYPTDLIEPMIKAGTKQGDILIDPFLGSGTTGEVARNLNRYCIGYELNPKYEPLIIKRMMADIPRLETFGK